MKTSDTYIEPVWLDKLDDQDRLCLQKAVEASYYGHKVEHILASVSDFQSQLWRGTNAEGRFIVVTQVFQHPAAKELCIWSIGGAGYLEGMHEVFKVLKAYAKEIGATHISAQVRKGFEKFAKDFGVKAQFTQWILEVDHADGKQNENQG